MFPVAFHLQEVLEFPELVERLPNFVELTNEETEDFFAQPSLFYVSCYTIGNIADASLRNISLYFIRQFACLLSIPTLSSLIESFDVSEATIRIVSVLTHCIRKNSDPGPGNPACESIKKFFVNVHRSMPQPTPFVMPTIWLFLAKAIPLISWEPNVMEMCSQFATWVIGLDRAHPVHISMAARLLHALYKAGWTVPGQLIPRIVRWVPFAVTQHLFLFLVDVCDAVGESVNVYATMEHLIPLLLEQLVAEIGDGNFDYFGDLCIMTSAIFRLLNRILRMTGELEFGEILFGFVESTFSMKQIELQIPEARIVRNVVLHGSPFSIDYLALFLDLLSTDSEFTAYLIDIVPSFLLLMRGFPAEYGNIAIRGYEVMNELIQKNAIVDPPNLYQVAVLVCWTIHFFPHAIDAELALSSFEALWSRREPTEATKFGGWASDLAAFDLLVSVELVAPVDVNQQVIEAWISLVTEMGVARMSEWHVHEAALTAIAERNPGFAEMIGTVISNDDSNSFLSAQFSLEAGAGDIRARSMLRRLPPFPQFG
jgi:hypothetical protein